MPSSITVNGSSPLDAASMTLRPANPATGPPALVARTNLGISPVTAPATPATTASAKFSGMTTLSSSIRERSAMFLNRPPFSRPVFSEMKVATRSRKSKNLVGPIKRKFCAAISPCRLKASAVSTARSLNSLTSVWTNSLPFSVILCSKDMGSGPSTSNGLRFSCGGDFVASNSATSGKPTRPRSSTRDGGLSVLISNKPRSSLRGTFVPHDLLHYFTGLIFIES